MPAHNESAGITPIIRALRRQMAPADHLIVVADNCTDNTASLARAAGATVIERHDPHRRGKGYALAAGLDFLAADPPAVVVMLDADCTLEPGSLATLVAQAAHSGRPAQAIYLQRPPANPTPTDQISAFAFLVKNEVRPRGLAALGQPVLLTGSGMAFPWHVIAEAPVASGNIVEDMQLGIDLALAGHPPGLAPAARVWGELPATRQAATTQRTRWEHGHMQTLLTQTPRLLRGAIGQRRADLAALALEVAVPPLTLLLLLWSAVTGVALVFGRLTHRKTPGRLALFAGSALAQALALAWLRFGYTWLPFRTLLKAPLYVMWKVPLYLKLVVRRQATWIRTERTERKSADFPGHPLT
jgi:cellulose synthase/poly-beta-1,6-N-acetylglucosamine synthase-like glycosyltransferase